MQRLIFTLTALFFISLSIASQPSFSQTDSSYKAPTNNLELKDSPYSLRTIRGGVLKHTESLCPEGHLCLTDGILITIEFTLQGCIDQLGPVSYHAVQKDGEVDLYVNAINVHDVKSNSMRCIKMPTKEYTIRLANYFGKVNLIFLEPSDHYRETDN